MANVIEQIVSPASYGGQIIEMNVRSNERGPQGEKGEPGDSASVNAGQAYTVDYGQQPQVMNTGTSENAVFDFYIPEGKPGAIHYTAGPGINITEDNRIEATGGVAVYWGDLVGNMSDQTDLKNALDSKQATLTAGTNITISPENVISATAYTAGSGLGLNGSQFSVDTDVIQPKLTAGANVQIDNETNTISATDTTYSNFVGADGGYGGSAGLVPAPIATDNVNVLKGDGSWGKVNSSNIDTMSLLNIFYPVGSYYETSDTSFDPNVSWGGTWVEDSAGKVTVAKDTGTFSTVGGTGGEETHTLSTDELPSHNHQVSRFFGGTGFSTPYGEPYNGWGLHSNDNSGQNDILTTSVGKSYAHNNLQPYIVVRRWHRTA